MNRQAPNNDHQRKVSSSHFSQQSIIDTSPVGRIVSRTDPFDALEVNKTANTSRTRVGRYLDDQPARMPRAHVFGLCHKPLLEDLAAILTSQPSPSEPCPFCGAHGFLLRSEAVSLLEAETGGEETDKSTPFHGSLWLCGDHLWGWRSRRAGVPVTSCHS